MNDSPPNDLPPYAPTEAEQRAAWEDVQLIRPVDIYRWIDRSFPGLLYWWFFGFHFLWLLNSGDAVVAWSGLSLQATLIAMWLACGVSPAWKRWLGLAATYFYVWLLQGLHIAIGWNGAGQIACLTLLLALVLYLSRQLICLMMRKTTAQRFTLREAFVTLAAISVALAIWSGPVRLCLQQQIEDGFFGVRALCALLACCWGAVILSPVRFRDGKLRWLACFVSFLTAVMVPVVLISFGSISGDRAWASITLQIALVSIAAWVVASLYVFSAEIVFRRLKIDFLRPIDDQAENEDANIARP